MNKSKLCILTILLFWTVSCTKPETTKDISNTANASTNANTTAKNQLKKPTTNLPKDVPNVELVTSSDIGVKDGVVISILPDKKYFIETESVPLESLKEKIEKLVASKYAPVLINADAKIEYGEIAAVLGLLGSKEIVQKRDSDRVTFLAEPPSQSSDYIATVRATVSSKDSSVKPNPKAKKLDVSIAENGKIKFDNKEINMEDLKTKLYAIFKDNDTNGIYLSGTNEPDRTVNLKVVRSVSYENLVKFIGELTEIRARIVLQFDNLES